MAESTSDTIVDFKNHLLGLWQDAKISGNDKAAGQLETVIVRQYPIENKQDSTAATKPSNASKEMLTDSDYHEESGSRKRKRFGDGMSDGFFNKANVIIGVGCLLVAMAGVIIAMIAFVFSAVSTNNASSLAAVQATNQAGIEKITGIAADIHTDLQKMQGQVDSMNMRVQNLESNIDLKLELHDNQNQVKTMQMMQDKRK